MSETADKDSKTEKPTERKVQDATEKGNWAVSREVSVFFSHLAFLGACLFLVKPSVIDFVQGGRFFWESADLITLNSQEDALNLLMTVAQTCAKVLAPLAGLFLCFGLLAACSQNMPALIWERIRPDFEKISIRAGWRRIFGKQSLVECLKACLKLGATAWIVYFVLKSDLPLLINSIGVFPGLLPALILDILISFLLSIVVFSLFLVAADILWTRYSWWSGLKMTKQEIRDEFKMLEGNPFIKGKRKARARQRSRQRLLARVPKATVVLANPSHYAIALRYIKDQDSAPLVLAKGQDFIALKIREIAEKNAIPVVENPPLVRAMYPVVDLNKIIPKEFYRAVAEIIYFVLQKQKKS